MDDYILKDLFNEVIQFIAQKRIEDMIDGKQSWNKTVELFSGDLEKIKELRTDLEMKE